MESNTNASFDNWTMVPPMSQYYTCGADPLVFMTLGITLGSVGLLGNLIFMFVVVRVKSMQTATNHYLINLAVADLLFLMCLWMYYLCAAANPDGSCIFATHADLRCVTGMVIDIALLTSNFSVTFIGIERYVAITLPFRARQICTKGKTIYFNVIMWILAIIIVTPPAVACHVDDPPVSIYVAIYFIFISVCFVSLCMVTILYSLTIYHFTKTSKEMKNLNDTRHHRAPNHDKAVVRLCVLTTAVYFACLFPKEVALILQLIVQFGGPTVAASTSECIHNVSIILLIIHSAANPIIYNVMSSRYRQAFKTALVTCFNKNSDRRPDNKSYYYSRTTNNTTAKDDGCHSTHTDGCPRKYLVCPKEMQTYSRTTSM